MDTGSLSPGGGGCIRVIPKFENAFDLYQQHSGFFDRSAHLGLMYYALKLNGEAGEVAEKVGKMYRDAGGEMTDDFVRACALELGDVLWYVARIARLLGCNLQDIARLNIEKLESRRQRGVLHGEGDNR